MLAGYLPFDDDPANPEGDNINLLYKYIVSTPLTFPEYVSPHARDLLRRILVPDPRKRADLFEVARHSWLSPFSSVVSKITSSTINSKQAETVTINGLLQPFAPSSVLNANKFNEEPPLERLPSTLARAASVREPSSTSSHPHTAAPGPINTRHHEFVSQSTQQKAPVDAKRRTVQVEYVKPLSWTTRGDPDQQGLANNQEVEEADAAPAPVVSTGKHHDNLARAATTAGIVSSGPVRTASMDPKGKEREILQVGESKGSRNRPASYAVQSGAAPRAPGSGDGTTSKSPSKRPSRDKNGPPVSGKVFNATEPGSTSTRPNTASSLGNSNRMPSRGGSYSRPVAPSVAANSNNAQGKIAMPKKPYTISNPIPQPDNSEAIGSPEIGKPVTAQPVKYTSRPHTQPEQLPKGHRRANTVGGGGSETGKNMGRIMGSSDKQGSPPRPTMTGAAEARQSLDQSRQSKYDKPSAGKSRRFSLLPTSFSLRSMSGSGHARRSSKSTLGRQLITPESQPQTSSQPQLIVPHIDSRSVLTGSDLSLGVESAPASAAGGGPGRDSIDVPNGRRPAVLQKSNRKFTEGEVNGTGGSSGPARRVMDFFRRRGVVRSKGEV